MSGFSRTLLIITMLSVPAGAIQFVSVADEIAIGKQAQANVKQQTPQVRDAAVRAYVARIGRRLVAHATGGRYPYSFSMADYKEINAFALPGGPVWVNRAHEIAHLSQRRAAQQLSNAMVTNLGLSLLGALLGNADGATAASLAARYVASGAFLRFSRDDEQDADRVATTVLALA